MKQNSIFYMRSAIIITVSEGVDGNEQCGSHVKEAPDPKRTKCRLNQLPKSENGSTHISDTSPFCRMTKF